MTTEATQYLSKVDQNLGRLIRRVGPCKLKPKKRRSPFETLVRSVVYQQLHANAAEAILARVKALFPHRRFPTPEDLVNASQKDLRRAGLSQAKTYALKDIALKTLTRHVPTSREILRMSNEEITERLTMIRGVGPWTVEMLLIFTLGRPDVLPATDYGVRKGFALTYGWKDLPTPKELREAGERWRPHRTTAAWYFWRALDL